jgi:hypothetical protein
MGITGETHTQRKEKETKETSLLYIMAGHVTFDECNGFILMTAKAGQRQSFSFPIKHSLRQ